MAGFNVITHKLKEMYQMLTLGGDAELELVDNLDPFSGQFSWCSFGSVTQIFFRLLLAFQSISRHLLHHVGMVSCLYYPFVPFAVLLLSGGSVDLLNSISIVGSE